MKKVEHYICELCGTEYNDKSKAMRCEKGHREPKEIVKSRYNAIIDNLKGYPIAIDIKMSDNNVITYKR